MFQLFILKVEKISLYSYLIEKATTVYQRCLQMKEVGKISQNVCGTDVCEHFPYKERVFHPISSSLKFIPFFVVSGPFGLVYSMSLTRYDRIYDLKEYWKKYLTAVPEWNVKINEHFDLLNSQNSMEYRRYKFIVALKKPIKCTWKNMTETLEKYY